jgi:hypothetical protein
MDNTVLKKKLSTFRSTEGYLVGVSSDVLQELLRAWEGWTGKSKDFYRSIGVNQNQIAFLLGKAKKMAREGGFPAEVFKEVQLPMGDVGAAGNPCTGIELQLDGGKIIRFPGVEPLIDFLKKSAA